MADVTASPKPPLDLPLYAPDMEARRWGRIIVLKVVRVTARYQPGKMSKSGSVQKSVKDIQLFRVLVSGAGI